MKKKTVIVVAVTLVLAILAVAVIATFPTYLLEDNPDKDNDSAIQSGNITENENVGGQGEDVGVLGGSNGIQAILPESDDSELGITEESNKELVNFAEAENAKVLAQNGAFEEGTEVTLKKLGIFNKAYYRARHYLRGIAENFAAYNLSATNDGKTVTPTALVRIVFDIPENWNANNVAIYYMLSDGGVDELNSTVAEDGKTVWAKISQSGVYILAEKQAKTETDDQSSDNTVTNDSTSTDTSSGETPDSSTDSSADSSQNNSSDTSSDTESDNSSEDNSSDNNSSEDPMQDSMDGWTPWY